MFTGLVQQIGVIRTLTPRGTGRRLTIGFKPWPDPLADGESVAVMGTCLTVTSHGNDWFAADVLEETLSKTALAVGPVNLERALAFGERLGGHLVTGHIDEIGTVLAVTPRGCDRVLRIGCSRAFARRTVLKGSAALDGVSLTVSGLGDDWFEVNLIPETLRATTLASLGAGDRLNLESDILGKYVERLLGKNAGGLTLAALEQAFGG